MLIMDQQKKLKLIKKLLICLIHVMNRYPINRDFVE